MISEKEYNHLLTRVDILERKLNLFQFFFEEQDELLMLLGDKTLADLVTALQNININNKNV